MALTSADIETAIEAIETNGQSFTLGDMTYNAANLSSLVQLYEKVKKEEGTANGTRPTFRRFQFGSMGY